MKGGAGPLSTAAAARPDLVEENAPLAPLTSWLVGGPADFLAQPRSIEEARACVRWATANQLRISVLGGGTNVLVSDEGVEGLVLCLRKLTGIEPSEGASQDGRFRLVCLAGFSKSELLKAFLKRKLVPALFLAGLPGDVGGGVSMNAGVGEIIRPREFVEIVDWIDVMRFDARAEIERIEARDLKWSYRRCEGWEPGAIVRVGISWPDEPDPTVLDRVREANRVRLSKQPLDLPSCGSVFVNPTAEPGKPALKSGQLIESCGLKGFSIGGAKISEKHANFIVNSGGATARDILSVIDHARATVLAKAGVQLKTEVVRIGR